MSLLSYDKSAYTIVSGGQTGVDIAGLNAARSLKFKTGGWAPHGWETLDGPAESLLKKFGLKEHDGGYKPRTIQNVKDSDITLIISRKWMSPGTVLTMNSCKRLGKPFIALTEECVIREIFGLPELEEQLKEVTKVRNSDDMDPVERTMTTIAKCLAGYPTINIAGNAEQNADGIELMSFNLIYDILKRMI